MFRHLIFSYGSDRRLSSSPSTSAHQRSLPPIPSVSPPNSNGYVDSPSHNEYSEPLPPPISLISDHHYENQPGSRRHLPSKPVSINTKGLIIHSECLYILASYYGD